MKRTSRTLVALIALVVLALMASAPARGTSQTDGGFFYQSFDRTQKMGKNRVYFIWAPHFRPGTPGLRYFAGAWCGCWDADTRRPEGKLKAVVKEIRVVGLNSGRTVAVPRFTLKVTDGRSPNLWHSVPALQSVAEVEDFALVEALVQVKNRIRAGQTAGCDVVIQEKIFLSSQAEGAGPGFETADEGRPRPLRGLAEQ